MIHSSEEKRTEEGRHVHELRTIKIDKRVKPNQLLLGPTTRPVKRPFVLL
jgi:hypothetical protein